MRFTIFALFIFVATFNMQQIYSQNNDKNATELTSEDFDNYTDEQILAYWEKAKSQGYSLDQLDEILKAKGVPLTQISKLKQRISSLRFSNNTSEKSDFGNKNISNLNKFGLNINQMAVKKELKPVIGREKEFSRICNVLLRREKNNIYHWTHIHSFCCL